MFDFSGIGAERYWLYFFTELMVAASPGAAVILVMSRGLAQGFTASLAATAAILTSNLVYFIASALGLAALIVKYPLAFEVLKYAGAIYLIYMAYGAWTARPGGLSLTAGDTKSNWQAFWQTYLIQASNPKAMLTFVVIVPPFINPSFPIAPQMAWIAAGSIIPELLILMLYGGLAAKLAPLLNQPERLRLIEKCIAILLLAIALMVFLI